jgi:tyrosine-protein kinase Etk/Wzc
MSEEYDLVLLDTPPILAVSDGAIVGRHAGVNLLVVRSGAHPMREILQSLIRLEQSGVTVQGVVFNGVPRTASARYANGVYQYAYPSRREATA